MGYNSEKQFEDDLVKMLSEQKGWKDGILNYKTEKELIRNWADILYENNRSIDRLGDYPLTDGEMEQILEQIRALKTPLRLNGFINGGTVQITRDNEADEHNFGKLVSLKIFDMRLRRAKPDIRLPGNRNSVPRTIFIQIEEVISVCL